MPRRPLASAATAAAAPCPVAPFTPSLSPIIQALRKDWRWASISQFINMFSDAFGLLGFDIETLEIDLDSTENGVLLDVIAKLLYALTWNRNINRENAFEHLRKQYLKRLPRQNPFGTLEEPIEWYGLGLGVKVQAIHQLCEWQLAEPARFRQLLKSDEDAVTWRIDPIGWDKAGNTYWLFDDNRLWVQHPPPAPPRPPKKVAPPKAKKAVSAPKRKPPPKKRAAPPAPEPSRSRKRTKVAPYGNLLPVDLADVEAELPTKSTRSSSRRSAAQPAVKQASEKAKPIRATRNSRRSDGWEEVPEEWLAPASTKDDDDSSELSELTDLESDRASSVLSEPTPDSDDGADEDVEMDEAARENTTKDAPEVEEAPKVEELPAVESTEDVKADEPEHSAKDIEPEQGTQAEVSDDSVVDQGGEAAVAKDADVVTKEEDGEAADKTNGVEADGVAVELDDSEVKPTNESSGDQNGEIKPEDEHKIKPEALPAFVEEEIDETDEVQVAARAARNPSFLEWECICVTLYEWQHVGERFQNLSHRDEKALHKLLVNEIAPKVIEVLQAKENERLKEEAVVNRKRSSRIAVRELEKEEAMKREEAQREAEERMERARRAERRQMVVEAETVQKSREARLREREERMREREEAALSNAVAESQGLQRPHLLVGDTDSEYDSPAPRAAVRSLATSGTSTPKVMQAGAAKSHRSTERWQLACEVCALTGWNLDNETEIVSCDICGRWQHVGCHDRADAAAGRPPRDWDRVDFKCRDCQQRARRVEEARHQPQQQSTSLNGAPFRPQQQQQQQHTQPQVRPIQYPYAPAPTAYAPSSQTRAPSYPLHAPGYPSPAPSYGSPAQGHVQSPSSYRPPVTYSSPASNGHQGYHQYGTVPQYMPRPPPPNIPHQPAPPRVAQPVGSLPYNGQPWRPSPQSYSPAPGPQYQPYGTQPAPPAQQYETQPFSHPQSQAQQAPSQVRHSPLQHVQQRQIRQSPTQGHPQLPPVQPPRQG